MDDAPQNSETILLCEDDYQVRTLTQRILSAAGYQVLVAATPRAALSIGQAHESTIHLLVSDMHMPEMTGRDLALKLVLYRPDLKILFVSGSLLSAEPIGFDYLVKPVTRRELLDKVREVLDS